MSCNDNKVQRTPFIVMSLFSDQSDVDNDNTVYACDDHVVIGENGSKLKV